MDTKKTTPNIDVRPESLGPMLEYWYIERGLLDNNKIKQGNIHYKQQMHITRSEYSTAIPWISLSRSDDRWNEAHLQEMHLQACKRTNVKDLQW